jgi:hypothetical protein
MLNAVAGVFRKELPQVLDEAPQVVVVLTTNYRDRIDDSLIRKGGSTDTWRCRARTRTRAPTSSTGSSPG